MIFLLSILSHILLLEVDGCCLEEKLQVRRREEMGRGGEQLFFPLGVSRLLRNRKETFVQIGLTCGFNPRNLQQCSHKTCTAVYFVLFIHDFVSNIILCF
jgi:hypothetical protein